MDSIQEKIETYLLNCKNFTELEYQDICQKYGSLNVSTYFDQIYNTISKEKVDEFLSKYHVYFDKKNNDIGFETILDNKLKSAVQLHLDSIRDIELLTPEEEQILFTELSKLRSELKILNIIDDLIIEIDFATIFASIRDERQIKSLKKLYKSYYMQADTTVCEKVLSTKDLKIIEKYLQLYNQNGLIPSKHELYSTFETLDLENCTPLDADEFDYQIDIVIKFLKTIKRIELSNQRLIVSIANERVKKIPMDDLIQEGYLGLKKAILKFDVNRGYKFSTYAIWWIRQATIRSTKGQARTIRLPEHQMDIINKLNRCERQLTLKLNREPNTEELAKEMNLPLAKINEIINISQEPTSLDAPIGSDSDSPIGDYIKDENNISPEEYIAERQLKEKIFDVLLTLTEREAQVIRLRFGLDNDQCKTLEEVGQMFGVTRERVRQIEAKAIRKFRTPQRSKHIKDYY